MEGAGKHELVVSGDGNKDITLFCLYVNAQSIIIKMNNLQATAEALKADIVGVLENWGRKEIGDAELKISGYNIFRKERPINAKGGRVLLYIHMTISKPLNMLNTYPSQLLQNRCGQ